ncbi:MAG: hypothetical protein M1385_00845 [Candidatus Marsarchaeota archaeon]|nr:hypothetical protein [Candidatus Marsarchaeota archaeon]
MGIDKYTMDRNGSGEAVSSYFCKLCKVQLFSGAPKFVVSSKELNGSRLVQSERVLCPKCYDNMQVRVYNRSILSNNYKKKIGHVRKANLLKVVG